MPMPMPGSVSGLVSGLVSGSMSGSFVSGACSGNLVSGSVSGSYVSGACSGNFMSGAYSGHLISGALPQWHLVGARFADNQLAFKSLDSQKRFNCLQPSGGGLRRRYAAAVGSGNRRGWKSRAEETCPKAMETAVKSLEKGETTKRNAPAASEVARRRRDNDRT